MHLAGAFKLVCKNDWKNEKERIEFNAAQRSLDVVIKETYRSTGGRNSRQRSECNKGSAEGRYCRFEKRTSSAYPELKNSPSWEVDHFIAIKARAAQPVRTIIASRRLQLSDIAIKDMQISHSLADASV
jgi:hypothetical protein